jgi:hypothetical protein
MVSIVAIDDGRRVLLGDEKPPTLREQIGAVGVPAVYIPLRQPTTYTNSPQNMVAGPVLDPERVGATFYSRGEVMAEESSGRTK